MTIDAREIPFWQRISASAANLIVRLWPTESKDWAHAFSAELSEIETPFEASRWLLGGFMLLTRERFKSFFRSLARPVGIPAGGNLELFAKQSARVPRTPRIVTILFLLASLAVLLHPEVRTAVRSVVRGYINSNEDTSRWSSVRQLRKEAENTRDPKLFALLSMLATNDDDRSRLADQAIDMDPSLAWIDYENTSFNMSPSDPYNAKRRARLEAWDPDNATVRLLTAESIFESSVSKQFTGKDSTSSIAKYPGGAEWLAALNRAYEAERYDNYSSHLNQLFRDVSATHPRLDPDIAGFIFPRARIPNLMNIRTFGKWLVSQGQEAEQRGDLAAAGDNYWKVVRFSALMRHSKTTLIERLIGVAIGKEALMRLQPLLAKTGQPHQAELFALQLAEWNRFEPSPWRNLWDSFEWSALNLQFVATLIFVLSIISVLSLLFSIAARRSSPENGGAMPSLASWTIDACPPLLLLCSSALYSIYHPFAEIYRRFLNVPSNPPDMEQLQTALYVTHLSELQLFSNSGDFAFRSWFAITSILVLLVLVMIARMFFRRPSAEPHP
jgi:hypothetical protein